MLLIVEEMETALMSNKRQLVKETMQVYTMKTYITTKNDAEEIYVLM